MKTIRTAALVILVIVLTAAFVAAVVVAFLFISPTVGKAPGKSGRAMPDGDSDRYHDGKFHNVTDFAMERDKSYPTSDRKTPKAMLPAESPSFLTAPKSGDLSFTWFGHSSFFLQMGTASILADPILSGRSSPVGFAGPKRFSELPVTAEELPDIDVLFLSHDHYDHMDYRTILKIKEKVGTFIVPLGVDSILLGWGVEADRIRTLDWWESVELDGVTYTLTPSQHFSGRNPLKMNAALWGGLYMTDGQHHVYYTGDGGYNDVFAEVGERLGEPDLMIGECGQYDPAWANMHMFPEETAQAGLDAGAKYLIPVHWGAFCICNHAWDDSIIRVTAAAEENGQQLATPRIGQTVNYAEIASFRERWWEGLE